MVLFTRHRQGGSEEAEIFRGAADRGCPQCPEVIDNPLERPRWRVEGIMKHHRLTKILYYYENSL